jgi:hypothetical protein
VLAILVVVALAAPLLGTVDPASFDAGSRDLLPGKDRRNHDARGRHAAAQGS